VNAENNTQIQNDDDRERSRMMSLDGSQPPAEIKGYTAIRRLGTGAYGTVWLAREDHTGRMVAVKFYPHRRGLNWSMLSREVEKLAAVYTSRNIVRLIDVGWNAEPPYFVMEYVENGSLASHMSRGALSVDEAVRIAREVCNALIDAHGAGVLHCDLKPDNVLLDGQLHARICDFGQARMSHEHSPALGTLYYMAPEQADLDALPDARWDVYAIGAMLYHMLTGGPPFRDDATQKLLESAPALTDRLALYRHAISAAPEPVAHRSIRGVDNRLAEIIDHCLKVNPTERLPNAQAVRDELDARDRHRARRPLLLLGVVGPVLLMASMVPIFYSALRNNLGQTEKGLTKRALESDALSARLQASSLEDVILDRLEELQEILNTEDVRVALEELMQRPASDVTQEMKEMHGLPIADRPLWMRLLDHAKERCDQANTIRQRSQDSSWFLTNAQGVQLWRRSFSPETLGRTFSRRDYFHGRNIEYREGEVPGDVQPIQTPHISLAYRSDATGRYMVALSVPVRDRSSRIIGVFARTVQLGDLQQGLIQRLKGTTNDQVERFIALADSRDWQLVDHPFLTESRMQSPGAAELIHQLRIDPLTIDSIQSSLREAAPSDRSDGEALKFSEVRLENYRDPVEQLSDPAAATFHGPWMAAMAPVLADHLRQPWIVIVQERKDTALLPLKEMTERASRHAWMAVLSALTLMAIVWSLVWNAFNRSPSSGLLTTTGTASREDSADAGKQSTD
jgi:serine/threonine protein kinase